MPKKDRHFVILSFVFIHIAGSISIFNIFLLLGLRARPHVYHRTLDS